MSRFFWSILIITLLAACSPASAPPLSTPLASLSGDWTIRFSQSGGIMGLMRTMEISNDGKATVTDQGAKKTVTIQLKPDELAQLKTQAAQSTFTPASGPSNCADCFIYTVEVDAGAGKPFVAQVDDTSLENSGLSALVTYLRGLMEKALKTG